MSAWARLPVVLCLAGALVSTAAPAAAMQTVCTITVNSADEKLAFQRHLPASTFRFVELVERGRPDWLDSACRAGVRCDVLLVSGHYDGSSVFFSDRLELDEHLPVAELERVACSDACPALFAQLKQVYLFGCNTLNTRPQGSAQADVVRGLVREGRSPREAALAWQSLSEGHGNSSSDRMRQIFAGVPVLYGFSALAPLGPLAAETLDRYFRAAGAAEVGRSTTSSRLLAHFAPFSMAAAHGITAGDPLAASRRDMCAFADARSPDAEKLAFVHRVLRRPMAEVRLHLDRIQQLMTALDAERRQAPAVARALEDIALDVPARQRFLDFARDVERPELRVRLLDIARDLGWLTDDQRWDTLALMLGELQARRVVGASEIQLACTLNRGGELDGAFNRRVPAGGPGDDVAHAAVRACLGSSEGRARTLAGLLGPDEAEVQMAQVHLRHRPITDAAELRGVATAIAAMQASDAQVRALEVLGRHYLSDREVLDRLVQLFAATPSPAVQAAVAGILLRADRRSIDAPQLLQTLDAHRKLAGTGDDIIDALIRRLQTP